jgi:two-component system nitrate/nitrite response regulator NarL
MQLDGHPPGGHIRVLVADSTRMHAQLLADALRRDPELDVVAAVSHAREFIDHAAGRNIDVVVVSCNLDEQPLRGIELLREVRAISPETRSVVLLDSSKREIVLDAFRAGARGLFSRHEPLESLSKCVHRVHEGQIWANSDQMGYAVETLASSPSVRAVGADGINLLSKRELEVVRCLAEGLSNREIAGRLGLSQHTIKNYLFRVFDKLGVSSRLELLFLTLNQPAVTPAAIQMFLESSENANHTNGDAGGAWCQKAAESGMAVAQVALAQRYWHGKGVARDLVSAYAWFLVSEKNNNTLKEEITAAKRAVADSLSTEQILAAQKKASEYVLKQPKQPAARVEAAAVGAALRG